MKRIIAWVIPFLFALPAFGQSITPQIGGGISRQFDGGISAGGSGNALWTPNLSSAVIAWWDAQDSPHITQSGGIVSAWADRIGGVSGTDGHSTTSYSATGRNGKAAITINPFPLSFGSNSFPSGSATSTIAIASFNNSQATQSQFNYGAGGSTGSWRSIGMSGQNGSGDLFNEATTGSINLFGADSFLEYIITASSQSLYVDGTLGATSSFVPATSGNAGNIGLGGVIVTIQQILVLNASPSTNLRQCLEGFESWYDGKAGANLPGGHPYKSAAPTTANNCT